MKREDQLRKKIKSISKIKEIIGQFSIAFGKIISIDGKKL